MTPEELERALSELHDASYGWALSCCEYDEDMAQDALQTAYVRALSGQARFGGRSSFRTWWFGVVRRTSQEQVRRASRHRSRTTGLEVARDRARASFDPIESMARSERSQRLVEGLRRLPRRQREVLHLVFYQERSIREAAEDLGIGLGSARTHYDRGKKRLRQLLAGETDE